MDSNWPNSSNSAKSTPRSKSHSLTCPYDDGSQCRDVANTKAAVDPWADATIDPLSIFQNFQALESRTGGAISDMNIYRSITPNDTPDSSKDGLSEPNSDNSDRVGFGINLDIFDDNWLPFGSDADFLADMASFNVNHEKDLLMFEEDKPAPMFQYWDESTFPSECSTVYDKLDQDLSSTAIGAVSSSLSPIPSNPIASCETEKSRNEVILPLGTSEESGRAKRLALEEFCPKELGSR